MPMKKTDKYGIFDVCIILCIYIKIIEALVSSLHKRFRYSSHQQLPKCKYPIRSGNRNRSVQR